MTKVIDVHAHWFPPEYCELFERLGGRKAWPVHGSDLSTRVADLDTGGIDIQVIGVGHNQPYFADELVSIECARFINDLYFKETKKYGGRIKAFGAIALPHVEASLDELKRCLDDLHFEGIGLGTSAVGRSLDDPKFEPIWAELDKRKTTVFLHPTGAPETVNVGLDAFMLGPKIGGPQEMTNAAIHLVTSGVTRRYPGIKWILATMGGTLPYIWRRFEEISECLNQTQWLEGNPRDELKKFFYDTTLTDDVRVIEFAAETFGVGQLVLGTDSPRLPTADWIGRLRKSSFSAAEFEGILGGTAQSKLGL